MKGWIGLAIASAVVIGAQTAAAVDVTSCGLTLPERSVGVLTGDLVCGAGETAVRLGVNSTLDLNGYDIVAPGGWGVWCEPGRRCTVIGHGGEIRDANAAVYLQNRAQLYISDVAIRDCDTGILAEDWRNGRKGSRAWIEDVLVTGSTSTAIRVGRVTAKNVSLIDNPGHGLIASWIGKVRAKGLTITGNATSALCQTVGCEGIEAGSFIGKDVVVTDNEGVGIRGKLIRMQDSTVTGNSRAGSAVDILSYELPRLLRVICNRAANAADPGNDWSVCQFDNQL